MRTYPWWQPDDQAAWSRAVERVKPCAATVDVWWRDEDFETWMGMTGSDAQIETEERARGGMWHRERTDETYVRLRQAFEDAQREIQTERETERRRRQQCTLALRMQREMEKRKAAVQTAAGAAEREPEPCIEISDVSFFGR